MPTRRQILGAGASALAAIAVARVFGISLAEAADVGHIEHSDAEWKAMLTEEQYTVLRHEGTEAPFTSELLHEERVGNFTCAGCDLPLFASNTKFDSGTGWPSFWQPIDDAVATKADRSFLMTRTAVTCARCDGHLGHVFDDGPKPTGLRYCMNGVAMKFVAEAA